ncbi:hypothetical protein SAMN05216327_102362 [Dyadobacter sp. SG02]|nr:hypothetical protein SAMN05216327_102362 [Dyadobacter sp. SG02]
MSKQVIVIIAIIDVRHFNPVMYRNKFNRLIASEKAAYLSQPISLLLIVPQTSLW